MSAWHRVGAAVGFGLLLLAAVAVEGAWGWRLAGWGGSPDLVLALVLAASLRAGPEAGALAGFAGGLLQDLAGGGPLGILAVAKLVVGFGVGSAARAVALDGVWVPTALALAATAAGGVAELGVVWVVGESTPHPSVWARSVAATACYNVLIAPLVFAAFRKAQRWKRSQTSRPGLRLWPQP